MAMIRPVPGWIMFIVEISGSLAPTSLLTFFCARSWVFGSMAVWIVRPPRLIMVCRSSVVLPRLGVFSRVRRT